MIPNFNKTPSLTVRSKRKVLLSGWEEIICRLNRDMDIITKKKKIVVVECYQGTDDGEILQMLTEGMAFNALFLASSSYKSVEEIRQMTWPDVTDDRIFGYMTRLVIDNFIDPVRLEALRSEIDQVEAGTIIIYGTGATRIVPSPDLMLYADMARWEIQLRMRRGDVSNLGIRNAGEGIESQYKRGYFVDWRVCDRLKREVMPQSHWILDTNRANDPAMISSATLFDAMKQSVNQPFSVVPYFDAGPWGGQWMKETFDLGNEMPNFAWCFNCVPEENSLLLNFHGKCFETPSINLVFFQPEALLGGYVRSRFGDEFPIRFDFLDTMGGGNLSLQVHPLKDYIQEKFGVGYTQDESYYLMEAGAGARVYLGLKEEIDQDKMAGALRASERTGTGFDDTACIQSWPARKHDHFLIPGGTVHCSGKDCMVLEISATPYIFTFKLWDWGRLGMDGKPRPINISHGLQNIQWERQGQWVRQNLVNRITKVAEGDGWLEEKTGLHELEFIETRRHRFAGKVNHHTGNGVNVITLVEGREIIVESPAGTFEPFVVHYAETFIVPAAVGAYSIRPFGESEGAECITIKAYIREN